MVTLKFGKANSVVGFSTLKTSRFNDLPPARIVRELNQYQGGMCVSGVLKTTERTPRRLISPLGPKRVATDQCGLAICTFHLGFSLGILLYWWQPCRQQLSKATLKVSAMPDFVTLNPAELTDEQLRRAETTFERLKEKPLNHAAEVGTDQQRASLDRAVLCDVLDLEEAFYEGMRRLETRTETPILPKSSFSQRRLSM